MNGNNHIIVQHRDVEILRAVSVLRAIDRMQAMKIGGFGSVCRVNATMLRLVRAGLLNRFFLGVGVGSKKAIYTLSQKGAAVAGVPHRRFRRKQDALYSGDLFLEHQLLLNDIYLSLHKNGNSVSIQNWKTFESTLPSSSVIPDAYFEFKTADAIKPVFLEVDKSTESKKIWKKKAASYLSFALSGSFEKHFGHAQFRVAVVTTGQVQLKRIWAAVSEQTSKVFWLTTFDDIKRLGFLSAIWLRPKEQGKVSFF
ncbi:MAG TPA: replication-relaxation family protein [Candidatus Angelobacter sp.]|nr:replication-relaxation family protein [Candidatus Angelobacter sp.]